MPQACLEAWARGDPSRGTVALVPDLMDMRWVFPWWYMCDITFLCIPAQFGRPAMSLTHTQSKKTSASSKNECPEEEGLKHHSLTVSRNCLTNGVYLVSPSLGTYPEECFGFYISLTFLWSSDIPEVCKVSLLSFMQAIIRLRIKEGRLPHVVNYQNMPNGSPLPRKLFVSTWLFFLTLQLVCSSSLLCTLRNWLDWYNSKDEGITFQITLARHPSVLQSPWLELYLRA